jgi:hypothetical protein
MATQVTGIKELDSFLKAIPKKYSDRFVVQASRKAAKPLVTTAKQLAPSDTGLLKKSIGIKKARKKAMVLVMPVQSKRFQRAKTRKGKNTFKSVSKKAIKTGAVSKQDTGRPFYAHFQAGTAQRQNKKGANRGQISGDNFMQKAYQQTQARVSGAMGDAMVAALQKEAKKRGY